MQIKSTIACSVVLRVLLTEIYWKWPKIHSAAGPQHNYYLVVIMVATAVLVWQYGC